MIANDREGGKSLLLVVYPIQLALQVRILILIIFMNLQYYIFLRKGSISLSTF